MSYYKWSIANDVVLNLQLVDTDGTGLTGAAPLVSVRRLKSLNGVILDGYYWNSASFVSTPTFLSMSEYDATNTAGLYTYTFSQSLEQNEYIYSIYYQHDTDPVGFDFETHYFVNTLTGSGDVSIYESEPSIR